MAEKLPCAGDTIPADCERIEVRVAELKQLFNSIDAAPFRDRDLDPNAEEFIVGWARESSRDAKLALLVDLDRSPGPADEPAALRDAIHDFFAHRAKASRKRLSQLLGIGRVSLLVGLVFLAAAIGLGDLITHLMKGRRLGELLREGLVICGWVAMWRPLEIFLYGWWPIRREARLYDRLATMSVRIEYRGNAEPDAWRRDWPAASPAGAGARQAIKRDSAPRNGDSKTDGSIAQRERGPVAPMAIDAVPPKPE